MQNADAYPQGDGIGLVSVSASGFVRLSGTLADGTAISYSNALSLANAWPVYIAVSARKGSINALTFENLSQTDVDGSGFNWYRPAIISRPVYPNGWPLGSPHRFLVRSSRT